MRGIARRLSTILLCLMVGLNRRPCGYLENYLFFFSINLFTLHLSSIFSVLFNFGTAVELMVVD